MSLSTGGRPAVAAAVLALTAAAMLRQFAQPAPADYFAHDQQVYLAMAQTPFAATPVARNAPASWRILPALLARAAGEITGLGPSFGFFVVTFTSFALIPIAAIGFLRRLGVSSTSATVCGTVAALAPPVVGYLSWDVVRVDAFGLLLLFAIAIAVVAERPLALCLAIVTLSLTKETVLIGAFFAVAWSVLYCHRMLPVSLMSLGLAVVIRWVALPWWLPPPEVSHFANLNGLLGALDQLSVRYVARRVLLGSAATWNVLLPLAAVSLIRERRTKRGFLFMATIAVALSQVLFASDTQRLVAAAYPFVLAVCAFELDRLPERRQRFVGAALVVGQLPWLLVYGHIVPDLPGIRVVEIAIFVFSLGVAAVAWERTRRPQPALMYR
jgi:hypothetical protein